MTAQPVEINDLACVGCGLTTDLCLSMREDCCAGCTHYPEPVDPDADVDEIAVARAVDGDKTVTLNRQEAAEAHRRLVEKGLSAAQVADVLGTTQRSAVRWKNGHTRPITRRGRTMTDSIDELLAQASRNPSKRIKTAVTRANVAVERVRELLREDEAGAAARERVARLEAELRAAKAALRGTPATASRIDTKAIRAWAQENGIPCNPRGIIPASVVAAYRDRDKPATGAA